MDRRTLHRSILTHQPPTVPFLNALLEHLQLYLNSIMSTLLVHHVTCKLNHVLYWTRGQPTA